MGNVAAISVPIQNWRACNTPVRWCTAPHPPRRGCWHSCAASTPQGVLAQLRREQGGKVRSSTVLAPADSFGRVMRLLRYLCENGVGPEQWLEVLEDVHQPYQLLDTSKNAINIAEEPVFCGICRF